MWPLLARNSIYHLLYICDYYYYFNFYFYYHYYYCWYYHYCCSWLLLLLLPPPTSSTGPALSMIWVSPHSPPVIRVPWGLSRPPPANFESRLPNGEFSHRVNGEIILVKLIYYIRGNVHIDVDSLSFATIYSSFDEYIQEKILTFKTRLSNSYS